MSDLENDILQMEAKIDTIVDNLKSINDHIHFVPNKSSFWSTSAWTKKWKHWRKHNKTRNDIVSDDPGPRFSLDAGRVSGNWDGYLVGRSFPKLGDENVPGGSTQTREYYLNTWSRRGKAGLTLERSNSLVADNSVSEYIHKHPRLKFHSIGGEKDLVGDDDGTVKKPRWWNLKLKALGNQISSKKDQNLSTSNTKCQVDELVSEKSPNHASSGLLPFYLTPLRASRRNRNIKE